MFIADSQAPLKGVAFVRIDFYRQNREKKMACQISVFTLTANRDGHPQRFGDRCPGPDLRNLPNTAEESVCFCSGRFVFAIVYHPNRFSKKADTDVWSECFTAATPGSRLRFASFAGQVSPLLP
jgi:hypothetical protein